MKKLSFSFCFVLLILNFTKAQNHPKTNYYKKGVVVTAHPEASKVGLGILKKGGNAVDAAVAVQFALAVVYPNAGNIGGGGFMVYRDYKGNTNTLDFREKAPLNSFRDMYLDEAGNPIEEKSIYGHLASGVPGSVDGMVKAHLKYGKLKWQEVLQPALDLAKNGFSVTDKQAKELNGQKNIFVKHNPEGTALVKDTKWVAGDLLIQTELANTLDLIKIKGRAGFYEGEVADLIADYMQKNNGLITKADLKNYKPVWREPVRGNYKEYEIVTMPPPSSGGIHVIQMLNILEHYNLPEMGHNSPTYVALLAEVMKYAYADRSKYLGDPDFFEVPVAELISKGYAKEIKSRINLNEITSSDKILPGDAMPHESMDTTHFSVADKYGNVTSNTYTLNSGFGSGIVVDGTGVLMNNEMDDFASAPGIPNQFGLIGGEANKIEPFKRPLSSMTPTIVFHENKPIIATGSPGGSRIITAVLQFLLNTLDFKMEISDATVVPRIHHQWKPDVLMLEKGFDAGHASSIEALGQPIYVSGPGTSLESLEIKNNLFYGFGDTRRPDSKAKGL